MGSTESFLLRLGIDWSFFEKGVAGHGMAGKGKAGHGGAWLGPAGQGEEWQGKGNT